MPIPRWSPTEQEKAYSPGSRVTSRVPAPPGARTSVAATSLPPASSTTRSWPARPSLATSIV
nr:hypothetical protein [Geodermatophilus bullaregiensis]